MNKRNWLAALSLPILSLLLVTCAPILPVPVVSLQSKDLQSFPMVIQEQSSWCGIACADMVAVYYYPFWNYYYSYYYSGDQYLYGGVGSGLATPPTTGQQFIANITWTIPTGIGMYVYQGVNFLKNYGISSQYSDWAYAQFNNSDEIHDYIWTSVNHNAPEIYRINTWYMGNGWPDANHNQNIYQQYIHYVVGYGYWKIDPNRYNNDVASVRYNDPYKGSSGVPYSGGQGKLVTINNLTDALAYTYGSAPYGYDFSGGYIIYNASALNWVSVSANIAALPQLMAAGVSSRNTLQKSFKLPESYLSGEMLNPPNIGPQTPIQPRKVALSSHKKGYHSSPGRH
jgi:hypothetical protein